MEASSKKDPGPGAEKEEEKWNVLALKKFSALFPQIPAAAAFDSLRFFTAFKVGELQHYFENPDKAVGYYKAAIDAKRRISLPDSLLFKPYLYTGIIYYTQNKFDSAIQFFKEAENIQHNYSAERLLESERLYNIFGVLYYERGNYRQAGNYFQKAIEVLRPDHEAYENLYVNYQINLAQINLRLEEYDKANSIYQKLLPMNVMTNEIYHNLGLLNLSLGAADKALVYFRKVSPAYNKIIRLYNNMGNAFFGMKQYDSAVLYYQKAIAAYRKPGTNNDAAGYGLTMKSLGALMAESKRYDSALLYYQKALHQFYPSFASEKVDANPERFSGVFSYINLFNTLIAKAEAWHSIFEKTSELSAAQQELSTYQSAFKLIEYVERTYESDEARLFLAKIKYTVHSRPIDIAYTLYNYTKQKKFLEALYFLDQQNKATALALSRQISSEGGAASSPLLKREQQLKAAITRLSIRATQVSDSIQLIGLNQGIRDNEIQLGKVQDQLNQQTAVKETNIPTIAALQNDMLDKASALISFHLSDNKLTTLVVTKDSVDCRQQELPLNFYEDINAFINDLKNPLGKATSQRQAEYYRFLFGGLQLQRFKRLILIPDDVLNYLPFESLKNGEGQFLIENAAVQYQYSSALLKKETSDFSGAEVLSFAPFIRSKVPGKFPKLPNSQQEIENLDGKQFFDSAATKSHFLQACGAYKIVHLATHAVVNSTEGSLSYIVFSPLEQDNLLYAQEIYNLPLRNTRLLILSACETASGRLVKGEGVMSLSRAFRYAGCANVITTLWKANDFSTTFLTKRIHRYLEKGYAIGEAVQMAKKDYLSDKTIHPRLKHPYYWSHLVFIGNVQEKESFPWKWVLVSSAVISLLGFLLYKKSRTAGQ